MYQILFTIFVGENPKRNNWIQKFIILDIEKNFYKKVNYLFLTNLLNYLWVIKNHTYYCCISVQESLDTETNELQMNLDCSDKNIFKKCPHCHQVFIIKKNLQIDKETCNACINFLEKDNRISFKIHVLWKDNALYRILSDLHHSHVDYIFCREKIIGKTGEISKDNLKIHLNSLLNYD